MKKSSALYLVLAIMVVFIYGCERKEELKQPVADFSFTPATGIAPGDLVTFNNLSTDATKYTWNFDDGTEKINAQHPQHKFAAPGVYNVLLIAENRDYQAEIYKEVTVISPVTACFTFEPSTAEVGEVLTFTNCSEGADSYEWDIDGNGTIDSYDEVPVDFYFTGPGTFEIKLVAIVGSSTDQVTHSITITESSSSVVACFTMSPNPIAVGEIISFTNCSVGADTYEWDIDGNGTIDSYDEVPIDFYFTGAGTYYTKLIARNNGISDEVVQEMVVLGEIDPTNYYGVPWGDEIYSTEFDVSGTNEWLEGTGDTWSAIIADGYYTIKDFDASESNYGRIYWTNTANTPEGNWELEAEIRNTIDNEQYGSGLMFGFLPDVGSNRFKFSVSDYLITVYGNTTGWTSTTYGESEDWNTLTVRKYEGVYYFFLNEVFLYSDTAIDYGNQFGFAIDQDTHVDVDWIGLWYIDSASKKSGKIATPKLMKKAAKSRTFSKTSKNSNSGKSMLMQKNDILKK